MTDQINIRHQDFCRVAHVLTEAPHVPEGETYGAKIQSLDGVVSFILDSHGNLAITTGSFND